MINDKEKNMLIKNYADRLDDCCNYIINEPYSFTGDIFKKIDEIVRIRDRILELEGEK